MKPSLTGDNNIYLEVAESIRLNDVLSVERKKVWERPLHYHDRTEQLLKAQASQVQTQLNEISDYAQTYYCLVKFCTDSHHMTNKKLFERALLYMIT